MKTVLLTACAFLALGGAAMAADVMADNELDATTAAVAPKGCSQHSSVFACSFSTRHLNGVLRGSTEENSVEGGLQSAKGAITFGAQKSCNSPCAVSGRITFFPEGKQPYEIRFGPYQNGSGGGG